MGNLLDHLKKCANKKFQCSDCDFEGVKADFIAHISATHEQKLLEKFDKNVKKDEEEKKGPAQSALQMSQLNLNFDRIGRAVNSDQRPARVG